jgi:hypothetical protein
MFSSSKGWWLASSIIAVVVTFLVGFVPSRAPRFERRVVDFLFAVLRAGAMRSPIYRLYVDSVRARRARGDKGVIEGDSHCFVPLC